MSVVTKELETREEVAEKVGSFPDSGSPRPPSGGGGGGGYGGGGRNGGSSERYQAFPISKQRLGMWILLTGITMLFAGLSSAYIVIRGTPWWEGVPLPGVLWLNTFVLLASSVTVEKTRNALHQDRQYAGRIWIGISGILGLAFLIGQLVAWKDLVAMGVYLPSTLHSSFFYVLTGLHGLHLLGGIAVLGYVWVQIVRNRYTAENYEGVSLMAMYWHFMDALWVYVFLLLILF